MSMVINNRLDFQWSDPLQKFCKETCPYEKDWAHCIGLCREAQTLACQEATQKINKDLAPAALMVKVMPLAVTHRHTLVVLETVNDVTTEIANFDLATDEREQFLPEWRAIGESRATMLKK